MLFSLNKLDKTELFLTLNLEDLRTEISEGNIYYFEKGPFTFGF